MLESRIRHFFVATGLVFMFYWSRNTSIAFVKQTVVCFKLAYLELLF